MDDEITENAKAHHPEIILITREELIEFGKMLKFQQDNPDATTAELFSLLHKRLGK